MKKLIIGLGLLSILLACSPVDAPPPTLLVTRPALATIRPTRGALLTNTPSLAQPPLIPSATADTTLLSQFFMAPSGILSFHYPSDWSIIDDSDNSELLVRAESPEDARGGGFFVVNLLNVQGEITNDGLRALAETYLENLFEENLDTMQLSYRQEVNGLIVSAMSELEPSAPYHFELRFLPRPPFYEVILLASTQAEWDTNLPLLDAMARSIVVNPELGATIPTPDVAAIRLSEGLLVQNGSMYQAKTGTLFVVGEVLNSSQQSYEDVLVTISLLDGNGTLLANQPWRIQRRLLPKGERSPFVAIFNPFPEGVLTFSGTAEALPADFYSENLTTAFETSVTTASNSALATYTLNGEVTNIGQDSREIELIAALYDAEGRVIAVTNSRLEADILRRYEQLPFSLNFYNKAETEIVSYQIWVEGMAVHE